MNFQYISDIHLTQNKDIDKHLIHLYIKPSAENLLVAGDIGNPFSIKYQIILKWFSQNFKNTYIIAGNHEYYGNIIENTNNKIQNLCNELGNIYFLNNSIRYIGDVCILGSVLWSDIDPEYFDIISKKVNIFNKISTDKYNKITPNQIKNMFNKNIKWIIDEVSRISQMENIKKIIIMTHYPPLMCFKKYKKSISAKDPLVSAYCNTLENILLTIDKKVKMWLCGHTHFNTKIYFNNVFVVSNCIGYMDSADYIKNKNKYKKDAVYVL